MCGLLGHVATACKHEDAQTRLAQNNLFCFYCKGDHKHSVCPKKASWSPRCPACDEAGISFNVSPSWNRPDPRIDPSTFQALQLSVKANTQKINRNVHHLNQVGVSMLATRNVVMEMALLPPGEELNQRTQSVMSNWWAFQANLDKQALLQNPAPNSRKRSASSHSSTPHLSKKAAIDNPFGPPSITEISKDTKNMTLVDPDSIE